MMASERFKNLVHFVVASCEDPHRLGATRLNKILWFSDTTHYRMTGESISGEKYVKRKNGPVPKAILYAIKELEADGKIHVREQEKAGFKIRIFNVLTEPNLQDFTARQREIVEYLTSEICGNHSASSISDATHDQIWAAANEGEEIPLYATLAASPGEISDEVMAWADSVVDEVESSLQAA
jgi:hypothetical protein